MQATPQQARHNAPRVIDPRNAWLMTSMMQDVTRYGTAARAAQLGRSDIAGKTGTTNDSRDTWFAGYTPDLVAVSWMGFDQPRPLGRGETGGQTALPIWINFMGTALRDQPQKGWPMPSGLISVRIDPETGAQVPESVLGELIGDLLGKPENGMIEHFYQEFPPPESRAPDWDADPGAAPAFPGTPL